LQRSPDCLLRAVQRRGSPTAQPPRGPFSSPAGGSSLTAALALGGLQAGRTFIILAELGHSHLDVLHELVPISRCRDKTAHWQFSPAMTVRNPLEASHQRNFCVRSHEIVSQDACYCASSALESCLHPHLSWVRTANLAVNDGPGGFRKNPGNRSPPGGLGLPRTSIAPSGSVDRLRVEHGS
jgi:hypothetical protein